MRRSYLELDILETELLPSEVISSWNLTIFIEKCHSSIIVEIIAVGDQLFFEPGDQDQVLSATKLQIPLRTVSTIFIFLANRKKTSQELRMLSSVTLDCQVTKIVMNSGS